MGGGSANFTYVKGIGTLLELAIEKLTDSESGLVTMRQNSYDRSISSANDRIDVLTARIDKYRLRLVRQFAAMEDTIARLQQQSGNLMSALGGASAR